MTCIAPLQVLPTSATRPRLPRSSRSTMSRLPPTPFFHRLQLSRPTTTPTLDPPSAPQSHHSWPPGAMATRLRRNPASRPPPSPASQVSPATSTPNPGNRSPPHHRAPTSPTLITLLCRPPRPDTCRNPRAFSPRRIRRRPMVLLTVDERVACRPLRLVATVRSSRDSPCPPSPLLRPTLQPPCTVSPLVS